MTHQDEAQHAQQARSPQPPQRPVQTLARVYAEIVAQSAQTSPWVALNEFFHEWWDYSRSEHVLLIAEEVLPGDPLAMLDALVTTPDTRPGALPIPERDRHWRWAVFCAAVADYLSAREGMEPPAWVADPRYTLAEPWYVLGSGDTGNAGDDEKALSPKRRLYLDQTTPPQFRRRNIFCSERIFANKYEFAQQVKQLAVARVAHADHTDHSSRASQTAPSTNLSPEKPTQSGG